MTFKHPTVYIATYSNTDVYECLVGDAPIMRRCKDDWVNATQILKLCDFPKAKRTKILEKGVQQGLHEKIQGGYGRFQGTWIPLKDARKLAEDYDVSASTVPVLYVDVNDSSVLFPRKTKDVAAARDPTPVKRKYVRKATSKDAITPKKMKCDDRILSQAVFAQEFPHALPRTGSNVPQGALMSMTHLPQGSQQLEFVGNDGMNGPSGQFQRPSNFSQYTMPDPNFNQQQQHDLYKQGRFPTGMAEPLHQQMMYQQRQKGMLSQGTNETNWSQEDHTRDLDTSASSTDTKLVGGAMDVDNSNVDHLLRFFSEDNAPIQYFLYNSLPDFNINEAIDDEGHLTLHWAASVGNLNLVHLLLSKGANPLVVNNFGLNPLSKCIAFNNCFDMKNFPHIADALEMCLVNTDINGRTPLHYLCQFSKVASKLPALSYYIDVIFRKLRVMSRNSGTGVDLMKNVTDHQDVNGNTCLHLAARAGCMQLVRFFLASGARDDLLDVNSQTAKALIMQLGAETHNYELRARVDLQPLHMTFSHVIPHQSPNHNLNLYHNQIQNQNHQYHAEALRQALQAPPSPPKRDEKPASTGLGTPIRGDSRLVETPDTQRTTIQDDLEEVPDHVAKEHLKSLLERQVGTVEANKENIFLDDQVKTPNGVMSTPRSGFTRNSSKLNILSVISETSFESVSAGAYSLHPPPLDRNGKIVYLAKPWKPNPSETEAEIKLPMQDVSLMVSGMMNLLSTSYDEQLSGLRSEHELIKMQLNEKKIQDHHCSERVKMLLDQNGFRCRNTLEDAVAEVASETGKYTQDLQLKEAQLQCSLGKLHAYELASLVEMQESQIGHITQANTAEEKLQKWALGVQLSQMQMKRVELAGKLAGRIRDFAINANMNKYRKLLSLSCGLKVEDIDGLIDGIEASLNEGTMQV